MLSFLHNTNPSRILIEIGPLTIYYYGLFLLLAIIASIFVIIKIAGWHSIKKDTILDLSIYLIVGGILGARIYDIFLELPYYLDNFKQIFKLWEGGLAIHGGIIGGFLALLLFLKKYKFSPLKIVALVVPGLALGQAIGRWGNWFNQELFGLPSKLPFAIPIDIANRPARYINETHFHPSFIYESIACLLLAITLFYLHWHWRTNLSKKREAVVVAIYFSAYAFIRFMLEFIKVDVTPIFFGLRWPQVASIIMFIVAIYILIKFRKKIDNIS